MFPYFTSPNIFQYLFRSNFFQNQISTNAQATAMIVTWMPVVQIPLDPMSAVARRDTLEMEHLVQVEFLLDFIF